MVAVLRQKILLKHFNGRSSSKILSFGLIPVMPVDADMNRTVLDDFFVYLGL